MRLRVSQQVGSSSMKKHMGQQGIGHVVLLAAVLLLACIGVVSYRVASANKPTVGNRLVTTQAAHTKPVSTTTTTLTSTKKELTKASSELNTDLDTSVLDEDIQSLDLD